MKYAAILWMTLAVASFGVAQNNPAAPAQTAPPSQSPPATSSQQPSPTSPGQAVPAAPAAPAGKRPPQAKTQPELDAFNAASALTDAAAIEKAANDFAAKYPDSELRVLIYKNAMQAYGHSNGGDKTVEMGRKVLSLDPDDPEALLGVAGELAEKTRDSDLDKDQRLDEAAKMAKHAIEALDTDLIIPPNTPQERIDAYKSDRKSFAYSIVGLVAYKRENYGEAENNFAKSLQLYPNDSVTMFRLALSQDKQNKYEAGLDSAGKAVTLAKDNPQIADLSLKECERLAQLSGKPKPASCAAPASAPK
jgi:tetratricopeptide (TPR) repeat protein